jgi:hypothetical protein
VPAQATTAQTVEAATQASATAVLPRSLPHQAQRQTAQAHYSVAAAEGAERTAIANLIAALGIPAATPLGGDASDTRRFAQSEYSGGNQHSSGTSARSLPRWGKWMLQKRLLKVAQRAYRPTIGQCLCVPEHRRAPLGRRADLDRQPGRRKYSVFVQCPYLRWRRASQPRLDRTREGARSQADLAQTRDSVRSK